MAALLFSTYCTYCDDPCGRQYYVGYIVPQKGGFPQFEYVWRTAYDAAVWRNICEKDLGVGPVLSLHPFEWVAAQGRAKGLTMAENVYEVLTDHRFPDRKDYAFLVPQGYTLTTNTEITSLKKISK
jgi:hypothetical protein